MELQPTIGLEIHVQLQTKTKMFCDCINDPDIEDPNTHICPICMAHPGTLPVANKKAIKKVQQVGAALSCDLAKYSQFDRKNYFYPDLPKGYQISQFKHPLCKKGELEVEGEKIRIKRIHLEEDTGKLSHPEGSDKSLVDFNRAGVPLMELVTEPDLKSGKQAQKFAKKLQLILKYLETSPANMEKGEMRIEVNISLAKKEEGREKENLGTKVELKNLNSFRAVKKGVDYEIERQTKLLKQEKEIKQETRGWVDKKQKTKSQRKKEEAHDYRYFPEPDLPPLEFEEERIEKTKASLPELPEEKRKRFKEQFKLPEEQINILTQSKDFADYFEKTTSELRQWLKESGPTDEIPDDEFKPLSKLTANYLTTELQSLLSDAGITIENCLINPENFAETIKMIHKDEISSSVAQTVLKELFENGGDPTQVVEEKDLKQISGEEKLKKIASEVIEENPQPVEDFQEGNENAIQALIGKIMQKTEGQANPKKAKEILRKKLED